MKDPLDNVTREIYAPLPKFIGRGGDRGGRRPKANYQTKMFRAGIIEVLKEKLKSGAIDEKTIETLTELVS
jgi:hypothetical protein